MPGWRSPARSASSARSCLISGNIPFKTEVASVFLYGQIESDNTAAAAAVSVVLLVLSFVLLLFVSWVSTRGQRRAG